MRTLKQEGSTHHTSPTGLAEDTWHFYAVPIVPLSPFYKLRKDLKLRCFHSPKKSSKGDWIEHRSLKSGPTNHLPLQMINRNLLLSSQEGQQKDNIFAFSPATATSPFFKGILTATSSKSNLTFVTQQCLCMGWQQAQRHSHTAMNHCTSTHPNHIGEGRKQPKMIGTVAEPEETPPNSWWKFSIDTDCAGN